MAHGSAKLHGIVITLSLQMCTSCTPPQTRKLHCVCARVFERGRETESGLCPLGLSVSLIKDRRLTERKCVARLACRLQQQHTIALVWRERANRRETTRGGGGLLSVVVWCGGTVVKERKSEPRGGRRSGDRDSRFPHLCM